MAVLLITYEHKTEGHDYEPFFEAIKSNANGWWHYLDNTWIVNTHHTADSFARKLFPFMTQKDRLLVVHIRNEHQGWLPQGAWDWLNKLIY